MASVGKRKDGRPGYQVRYRDPAGKQRAKQFTRKADADRFAATIEADKARGTYLDPKAGRMTLQEYGEQWLAMQTFDEATRIQTELRLRLHVYPVLGATPLAALRPSQVQALIRGLSQTHAPRTVRVIKAALSAVLSAAVDDERVGKNVASARSVKMPALAPRKVEPWTKEQTFTVQASLPASCQAMVAVGAGLGLRQGEIFGLRVNDVDFLRGVVHVRQQVKVLHNKLIFAPPKRRKERDVPLADSVGLVLAAHLAAHPPVDVTLPWDSLTGAPHTSQLVFSTRQRTAWHRSYFNKHLWKPAIEQAGLENHRKNGMHALRHFFASVLLDAGESIRALAEYLGHADPGFTLRIYTHLMPASETRTKKAVDDVFLAGDSTASAPTVHRAVE